MHPDPVDSVSRAQLCETVVRLVRSDEQPRYQQLMREHHYLGYLPKIGETLWYVASWREQWLALLSFSGSALKCAPRDPHPERAFGVRLSAHEPKLLRLSRRLRCVRRTNHFLLNYRIAAE